MFQKILIANRGEIALRVLRACQGARHPDGGRPFDRRRRRHACAARRRERLHRPAAVARCYLNIHQIVAACEITGADAIHPGYGFLSENAKFADILAAHNITFIGPSADHIRIMGDKIEAKRTAKRLGIPVVPGSDGAVTDEREAQRIAAEIGYPGHHQGLGRRRRPRHEGGAHGRTRSRSRAGDGAHRSRRRLRRRRRLHREISRKAAPHRDAGARRRHRPRRSISASATARCSAATRRSGRRRPRPRSTPRSARASARHAPTPIADLGYSGAGTIEFLYEDGEFYFIEMNTRLQVEHPVTEAITGIDLVHEQIRVASGGGLSVTQDEIRFQGHAIECRINAEDPRTFVPSPGTITHFHTPGGLGIRVDSGVYSGYRIPPYYDSLIGKLIVHGRNRVECMMRLRRALDEFVVDGIKTDVAAVPRTGGQSRHRQWRLRHPLVGKAPRRNANNVRAASSHDPSLCARPPHPDGPSAEGLCVGRLPDGRERG